MISIYTPKNNQKGPAWSDSWRQRKDEAEKRRLQIMHAEYHIKLLEAMNEMCSMRPVLIPKAPAVSSEGHVSDE